MHSILQICNSVAVRINQSRQDKGKILGMEWQQSGLGISSGNTKNVDEELFERKRYIWQYVRNKETLRVLYQVYFSPVFEIKNSIYAKVLLMRIKTTIIFKMAHPLIMRK